MNTTITVLFGTLSHSNGPACVPDVPALLQAGLAVFGSLRASREAWAAVLAGLGVPVPDYLVGEGEVLKFGARQGHPCVLATRPEVLYNGAMRVINEGTPDPGENGEHPVIALVCISLEDDVVSFATPGGVEVNITQDRARVSFPRKSNHAAFQCAAGFASRGWRPRISGHVPACPWDADPEVEVLGAPGAGHIHTSS